MQKVILVTGGSRGIGAATCHHAATAGYTVAVNFHSDAEAADTLVLALREKGVSAAAFQADVGVEADVVKLFSRVTETFGSLDALVNSAGIAGTYMEVVEYDAAMLQALMQTNVIGTMLCCREATRFMSNAQGGKGGAIVNVSSMAGTIGGRPGDSAYAASKAAVDAFTAGFAKEVGAQGIRVNTVRPGVTLTDMTNSVQDNQEIRTAIEGSIAMQRVASADEIAGPIMWLLSDEASFISGAHLNASGGGFLISGSTKKA
ncbi:MAG: SDR family oxidoreductase [Granulosicoccus sp.]|nr:SDR family oxidoreductase [Granulosicoccus sp.]